MAEAGITQNIKGAMAVKKNIFHFPYYIFHLSLKNRALSMTNEKYNMENEKCFS